MAGEQFGRDFDYVPSATGLLLSLKLAAGVTFFGIGADTYTLKSASTYNGSPAAVLVRPGPRSPARRPGASHCVVHRAGLPVSVVPAAPRQGDRAVSA